MGYISDTLKLGRKLKKSKLFTGEEIHNILRGNGGIVDNAQESAISGAGNFLKSIAKNVDNFGSDKSTWTQNIVGGLASPFVAAKRGISNGDMKEALRVFHKGGDLKADVDYGKAALGVAGAAIGVRGTMGAVKGAFTDGQGNIDLPGIPFF